MPAKYIHVLTEIGYTVCRGVQSIPFAADASGSGLSVDPSGVVFAPVHAPARAPKGSDSDDLDRESVDKRLMAAVDRRCLFF
jgi:hypothetical protein